MTLNSSIAKSLLILVLPLISIACNQNRQVVPYESDSAEVFTPLQPNEEDSPDSLTFGENKVPGFIFDYDMTTSNQEVFVYYQNFTLLDMNENIIQDLFEFSQKELCEYGFVNDTVSLPSSAIKDLIASGLGYQEASAKIIDIQKEEFEKQIATYDSMASPMNIYFQIYPVYLDKNYVTYLQSAYCYTGGAHGMTAKYLKTYNLSTGKHLTLDDIVKQENLEEVREEVVSHMAYSYPIYENITTVDEYLDSLNVWVGTFSGEESSSHANKITINNFPLPDPAITEEGLVFVYQMYLLTPGSDGCPVVVIPYKDVKGCLNISPGN